MNVLDAEARWPVWCARLPPDWHVTSLLPSIAIDGLQSLRAPVS